MTTEEGYQAARSTAISVIATLKQELGELDQVKRIVKVMGMVNSTPEYTEQHLVMNGFSDLIGFRREGKARAIRRGYGRLPFNFAVEVDLIVEVE